MTMLNEWIDENLDYIYNRLHNCIKYKSIESAKERAMTMIEMRGSLSKQDAELHYDKL